MKLSRVALKFLRFILFVTILARCKPGPDGNPILMRLNPETDSNYSYSIKTRVITSFLLNGEKNEKVSESDVGLTCSFSSPSATARTIKLTYNKLLLKVSENDMEETIDASNGEHSFDPVEKILSNIIGKSVTVILDSGKVKRVDGTREITEAVIASVGNIDVQSRKRIEDQIANILGARFVDNTVMELFGFFPDSALRIGENWIRNNVQSAGVDYELTTKYTLSALKNRTLYIDLDGDIKALKTPGSGALDHQTAPNIKGEQEGYIEVDKHSGILNESKNTASMSGTLSVMGNKVPVEIKVEKEVTARRF